MVQDESNTFNDPPIPPNEEEWYSNEDTDFDITIVDAVLECEKRQIQIMINARNIIEESFEKLEVKINDMRMHLWFKLMRDPRLYTAKFNLKY